MESRPILVVLADPSHLDAARQALAGAVVGGGWTGDRGLLVAGADAVDLAGFEAAGVHVFPCPFPQGSAPAGAPELGPVRVRLLKFELFGPRLRRWRNVVYLDVDTIVQGPIAHLGRVRGFWAAPDARLSLGEQFVDPGLPRARGCDPMTLSFNSGVMAFSTDVVGADACGGLYALQRACAPAARFWDQPILNLWFHGRWRRLSQAYNYFPTMPASLLANARTASIVHFPAMRKPWAADSPYRGRWESNRERFGREDGVRQRGRGWRRAAAPAHSLCLWQLSRHLRLRHPELHRRLKRLLGSGAVSPAGRTIA